MDGAVVRGDRRQHARGHHRAGHHRVSARCGWERGNRRAANRFRRQTASAIPTRRECRPRIGRRRGPARSPRRHRRPRPGPSNASAAPGSSGFGNATVGKSGSGFELCGDGVHLGEPGAVQCLHGHRAAHPVQRREGHPRRTGAAPQAGGTLDVALDQIGLCGFDRCPADVVGQRCVGHRGLDLAVGGGDDLDAAVGVHLVAVVGRRVMRGRDLDPGERASVPHRERDHRSGHRTRQKKHRKPLIGKHFGGHGGEDR